MGQTDLALVDYMMLEIKVGVEVRSDEIYANRMMAGCKIVLQEHLGPRLGVGFVVAVAFFSKSRANNVCNGVSQTVSFAIYARYLTYRRYWTVSPEHTPTNEV